MGGQIVNGPAAGRGKWSQAYAQRGELVRPAFVHLDKEGAFRRVVRADYEDDEAVWLPEAAE